MYIVLAALSALFAALVAIFGKLGLKTADSTLATTIRSTIMTLFLILVSLSLGKFSGANLKEFTSRDWIYILAAGISGALSWIFYFSALKIGLASHVASIDRMSLVLVFILSAIFLGETFGIKQIIGAILMATGVLLIV